MTLLCFLLSLLILILATATAPDHRPLNRCYRAFVDNTDASATGTYHRNIRFVSAQRGKKTRSAASRYRRYVRLTSTTGELRLLFLKCHSKKEEGKDTPSEKSVQSVGVRVHTPPRLHYLRSRWASGIVQCLCLRWL